MASQTTLENLKSMVPAEIDDGIYSFKPLAWVKVEGSPDCDCWEPKPRFLHRTECTDGALYSFGGRGYRGSRNDRQEEKTFREVWQFDFLARRWTRLQVRKLPDDFSMCCATLRSGNVIFLSALSNEESFDEPAEELFVAQLPGGNGRKIEFRRIAQRPFEQFVNRTLVPHGKSLFKVDRTGWDDASLDVYALPLRTGGEWSLISDKATSDGPQPTQAHRTVCHLDRIYVFGGGATTRLYGSCTFEELPVFDLNTNTWQLLRTVADADCHEKFPPRRGSFECVQVPSEPWIVYIIGGYQEVFRENFHYLNDCWRIDLRTLQWNRIDSLTLPHGLLYHSISITPDGRMCVFGGIDNNHRATADLFVAWATVPKLADACFEAVQSYIRDGTIALPKNVRKIGLPKRYEKRLLSSGLVRCTTGRLGCACLWCRAR